MAVGAKRYVIDGRKIAQLNLTLASDIAKAINQEVARIRGRTEEGLRKAAEMVKERAQALTPIDTTALRESAYVEIIQQPSGPAAEIGFARPSAPSFDPKRKKPEAYAVYVHENMEAHHPHGQAKFLEEALKRSERDIIETVKYYARKK